MKVKTSLTLSEDLLSKLDRMAGSKISRSSFIEAILREYVTGRAKARRIARDAAEINLHAQRLNDEMADALSFQSIAEEE